MLRGGFASGCCGVGSTKERAAVGVKDTFLCVCLCFRIH